MNINDVFPSKYLKASDLQGKAVKVVIDKVTIEKMGEDNKPVLYFKGKDKAMALNKTNAQMIAAHYSPETNGWLGKEIKLYAGKVNFNGQMVDSLKVEVVPQVADGPDDELPPF